MKKMYPLIAAALLSAWAAPASAVAQSPSPQAEWQWSLVLDVASTSRALALGARDQGLQLGHSDFTLSGPVGPFLRSQLTAAASTHEGQTEKAIEEAWVETTSLPYGMVARAGRFASQVGYLNAQHPHADDFVERPLLYRAFLGGHWFDDGVRLNITLPTPIYWVVGAEAFRGKKLIDQADPPTQGASAFSLTSKWGGDFNPSHSWQVGLSYLKNRRNPGGEESHDEDHEEDGAAHDDPTPHHHQHGAEFAGRKFLMLDATWKWAPQGNNSREQLRVSMEAARITGLNHADAVGQEHEAVSVAAVWRFHPNWETGVRWDRLRVVMPHDDHVDPGRLSEKALMMVWKPSHRQTLRLQWSRQTRAQGFDDAARRSVALQYVLAFGAHGAHGY